MSFLQLRKAPRLDLNAPADSGAPDRIRELRRHELQKHLMDLESAGVPGRLLASLQGRVVRHLDPGHRHVLRLGRSAAGSRVESRASASGRGNGGVTARTGSSTSTTCVSARRCPVTVLVWPFATLSRATDSANCYRLALVAAAKCSSAIKRLTSSGLGATRAIRPSSSVSSPRYRSTGTRGVSSKRT